MSYVFLAGVDGPFPYSMNNEPGTLIDTSKFRELNTDIGITNSNEPGIQVTTTSLYKVKPTVVDVTAGRFSLAVVDSMDPMDRKVFGVGNFNGSTVIDNGITHNISDLVFYAHEYIYQDYYMMDRVNLLTPIDEQQVTPEHSDPDYSRVMGRLEKLNRRIGGPAVNDNGDPTPTKDKRLRRIKEVAKTLNNLRAWTKTGEDLPKSDEDYVISQRLQTNKAFAYYPENSYIEEELKRIAKHPQVEGVFLSGGCFRILTSFLHMEVENTTKKMGQFDLRIDPSSGIVDVINYETTRSVTFGVQPNIFFLAPGLAVSVSNMKQKCRNWPTHPQVHTSFFSMGAYHGRFVELLSRWEWSTAVTMLLKHLTHYRASDIEAEVFKQQLKTE